MRRTRLTGPEGRAREMRTDDAGTTVLDEAGRVVAEHGNDRHEALLAEHCDGGWRVTEDGHVAPEGAGAPGPARQPRGARPGDPAATVADGEAG